MCSRNTSLCLNVFGRLVDVFFIASSVVLGSEDFKLDVHCIGTSELAGQTKRVMYLAGQRGARRYIYQDEGGRLTAVPI